MVSVCPVVLVLLSIHPPRHPSIQVPHPEEEDDGRVYYYKEIGVGVLMQLFLIAGAPPPHIH